MARNNVVEILITAKNQTAKAFNAAKTQVNGFTQSLKTMQGAVAAIGISAVFLEINQVIRSSIQLAKEQARVEAQLAAVIKSTGGAAGITAEEVKRLASELQGLTNYGDEATIAGANLLLTFKNISSDTFPAATAAMLDMSAALGQDLQTSAIQLGKALNDPITGVGALTRVGVSFTEQQKEQIATLAESGRIAEAQAVILGELSSQFEGSAEAAREADGGYQAMLNSVGDLQEVLGSQLAPALSTVNDRIREGVEGWTKVANAVAEGNRIHERAVEITGLQSRHMATQTGRLAEWEAALGEASLQLKNEARSAAQASAELEMYEERQRAAEQAARTAAQAAGEIAAARHAEAIATQYAAQAAQQNALANAQAAANAFASGDAYTGDEAFEAAQALKEEMAELPETMSTSFDTIANNLSNQLSGAVNNAFGRMQETVPGMDEMFGAEDPGEFGRRLGALADGLDPSDMGFIEKFKEQTGGNPVYDALLEAIKESDSEGVAAEANRLISENLAQVIATGLKDSVLAQMRQQEVLAEAQRILAEELGEPAEVVTGQLESVTTEAGNVKTKADEMSEAGVTGTNKWIARVERLNTVLGVTYGLVQDVEREMGNVAPVGDATSIEQIGGMVE
jgi:hypothetical protein